MLFAVDLVTCQCQFVDVYSASTSIPPPLNALGTLVPCKHKCL